MGKMGRELWEPLPEEATVDCPFHESDAAYQAFLHHAETMPCERVLKKTAKAVDSNHSWVQKWSHYYCWRERLEAYDSHMADHRMQKKKEAIAHAQKEIADELIDLVKRAIEGAKEGDVTGAQAQLLQDLLDRGGLRPTEQHEVEVLDPDSLASLMGIQPDDNMDEDE